MVWKVVALVAASWPFLAPSAYATGVVQWDISKRHHPKFKLDKRAGALQEVVQNSLARGGYFAVCSIGSPPQDVTLQVDTGSSDVWVPARTASICDLDACTLGSFDSGSSSTFDDFGPGKFEIAYMDRSYSKGDYFRDTFSIAGATVANFTMGLGQNTTIAYGLLGVGYSRNEAIIDKMETPDAEYPNLPAIMMNQGLIATNAYSLWLNDLDASTGSILFGGIDTEKYVGNLTRIPIIKDFVTNQYDSFIVGLTSVLAISSSGTDRLTSAQGSVEVVLDSGTTLSYLPTDLAEQLWDEVGATYSSTLGLAIIPCDMHKSLGHFDFTFAGHQGPSIRVGMDELVLDLVVSGPAPTYTSGKFEGQDACEFGIQNTTGTSLLGDTFLRSAYVVYDLSNNEIGIAQTDFNETESNIVPFPSQGAFIPSATQFAPNQSLATGTANFTEPAQGDLKAEAGFSDGVHSSGTDRTAMAISTLVFTLAVMGGFLVT